MQFRQPVAAQEFTAKHPDQMNVAQEQQNTGSGEKNGLPPEPGDKRERENS